ncbi:MAG: SDR family oxidoreductase [Thermoleophilia bacterium]
MTTIASKHVLITGGASGLGRGLVMRCAALGATVSVLDLDEAGAVNAAAAAAAQGAGPAAGYACDVGDRDQVAAVAQRVRQAAGPVDILVNNAGVVSGRPLLELSDERIETTFRVNALGPFWVTRAFLPDMVERGSGHIVVVASAAGLIGSPRQTDYSATKHAAVGFTESLRLELRRSAPALRTTVVCPYYIDTGMFAGVKTRFPALLPILREDDVVAAIIAAIQFDRPLVQLPWMVRTLPVMRLLPVPIFDRLAEFFGLTTAMDEFVGRKPAAQPPARVSV